MMPMMASERLGDLHQPKTLRANARCARLPVRTTSGSSPWQTKRIWDPEQREREQLQVQSQTQPGAWEHYPVETVSSGCSVKSSYWDLYYIILTIIDEMMPSCARALQPPWDRGETLPLAGSNMGCWSMLELFWDQSFGATPRDRIQRKRFMQNQNESEVLLEAQSETWYSSYSVV